MKNYFTITISDVYGAKHYSFKQAVRKFAWLWISVLLIFWVIGGISLYWMLFEARQIEADHELALKTLKDSVAKTQADYEELLKEKILTERELTQKSDQLTFLDQTLQGVEDLIGLKGNGVDSVDYQDRMKRVQLDSLGKRLMLELIPSGSAVKNYKGLTSPYGYRKHPITGLRQMHGGIDYKAEMGEPVLATADGVVQFAGYNKSSGYGNLISIAHSNGFRSRYGHLKSMDVKVGDYVSKGQVIGTVGSSGRSTGPHLHYEVWFLQRRLDPEPFQDWDLANYDSIFEQVKKVPWGSLSQAVDHQIRLVEKQFSPKNAPSKVN
ncbi:MULTISPECIES: M23 family metallopeptidase [Thiomicrorhabdus]|uniref:M23 family metallopeptidase n=1 Tax=Thiomicrorhabdus heinhorstiae TaxID=2748010 RepID=A0ABS0BU54_9GAMM|nr:MULTISPECIES: M23 family metallopeptidase [Thiomicrorhabdus]MBF6057310.1 M23 family metallopeptidase [Thiomicrorhabdus heinhorstiae]